MASAKHPGFKAAQTSIAKREGVSKDAAGAILASAARKASPAAKRANPNLGKVAGATKPAPRKSTAGEGSKADQKQDAAQRRRTGQTQAQAVGPKAPFQGRLVESSAADRKADAARTRGARAKQPADHLAIAAQHRVQSEMHREAADKHVAAAVNQAAKGAKARVKDGLSSDLLYGTMAGPGIGEAVRAAMPKAKKQ